MIYKASKINSSDKIRLHLNENLFTANIESKILRNIMITNYDITQYPDDEFNLKFSIAKKFNIDCDNVFIGNGASDLLNRIFSSLQKKDNILLPSPSWSYYSSYLKYYGCNLHYLYLNETVNSFEYNLEDLEKSLNNGRIKITIICSPNNPTGNSIDYENLFEIVEKYRDTIFIIDQAYWGFVNDKLNISNLITSFNNLVIIRSFSKVLGLAGIRIGYAFTSCEKTKKMLIDKSPAFGHSISSQKIAISRLNDEVYLENIQNEYKISKNILFKYLKNEPMLKVFDTDSNFVLIRILEPQEPEIQKYLKQKGMIVKNCEINGKNNFLRVTIGHPKIVLHFVKTLLDYYR